MQDKLGKLLKPGQLIVAHSLQLPTTLECEVVETNDIADPRNPESPKFLKVKIEFNIPVPSQFGKAMNVYIVKETPEAGAPASPPPGPRLITEK